MTHSEIDTQMRKLISLERINTHEILVLINRAEDLKTYLVLGFPSLFEWLTRGHGYPNASAYRRIEAARLLRVVPAVADKIKSGDLNLSTLCKANSLLRTQERQSGKKISKSQKQEIVSKIENKSIEQTERILMAEFPQLAGSVQRDQRTIVNETLTRCAVNLNEEAIHDLNRAREVLGHRLPYGTDADVIAYALKFMLKKLDLLRYEPKKSDPKRGDSKNDESDDCKSKNRESDDCESKNHKFQNPTQNIALSDNHTAYSLPLRKRSAS